MTVVSGNPPRGQITSSIPSHFLRLEGRTAIRAMTFWFMRHDQWFGGVDWDLEGPEWNTGVGGNLWEKYVGNGRGTTHCFPSDPPAVLLFALCSHNLILCLPRDIMG